jgi:predicted N-formylglutamate amidohydrolase
MVATDGQAAVSPEPSEAFRQIGTPEPGDIVAVCDHASNHVPADIDLGIATELLEKHIAWDIGAAAVTERLATVHGIPGHLAAFSRLVCDVNREEAAPGLVPHASDGHAIPGNLFDMDMREARIGRFFRPYHEGLAAWLGNARPALILSIHSFTPSLESAPADRPWEIGVLYNEDDRAARVAIPLFAEAGCIVGDNQPYSGKVLNATMNRHAEAHGRDYLGIELRQDLVGEAASQAKWADLIAEVSRKVVAALAAQRI